MTRLLTAKTLEEAVAIADDDTTGETAVVVDPEGQRWEPPPSDQKLNPAEEAQLVHVESLAHGTLYLPPGTKRDVETVGVAFFSPPLGADEDANEGTGTYGDYQPETPEEEQRAKALKRLGGGPIVRAEREERDRNVRIFIDGMRRRPVL